MQWFDIGLHQHEFIAKMLPPKITDHTASMIQVLSKIGFEFEVREDVVRLWGYLPKCYEDFPPAKV